MAKGSELLPSEQKLSTRPDKLPDFRAPPLNEVVMGVQFMAPRGYQQIHAGEVWALYRDRFPTVEEHPPIPPAFETFGLSQGQQISFGLVTGASHDRFWFISEKRDHLIQFQCDRFLHNWRKAGIDGNEYPRFERIVADFEKELSALESYMRKFGNQDLSINQCEISYINHVTSPSGQVVQSDDWFKVVNSRVFGADDLAATLRRTIRDETGAPCGRLICELTTAVSAAGHPLLVATLTARGAPQSASIADALAFIHKGREMIVSLFAEVTTDSAHRVWERSQ